jgi:transcriptional regulator with XRE-family HTH domain
MSSIHTDKYQRLIRRLQQARRDAGLTQAEVAEAVGRPQSFVSKCESGERRLDVVELEDLATIYGKTLGFFVAEPDSPGGGGATVSSERRARYGARKKRGAARRRPR